MPDMIDVVLAKALTPQGQIQSAARQAREAVADANDAVETIESLTSEAERIQQLSRTTLTEITSISEYAEEIKDGLAVVDEAILGELNDEINKLAFELNAINGANARVNNIKISYPDGEKVQTLQGVVKYYNTIGQNQDGTMTQKAITNALAQGGTGGNANLGPENAGKMVKVGSDGYLTPSEITQEALLNGNIHIEPENPDDIPMNTGILGLNLNYATSTYTPTDDAVSATTADFDTYAMYGGRKRCLVDNDGTIVAFYGDNNYTDTPSNGYQVMVYQPKFYYKRIPINTQSITNGTAIREETIKISSIQQEGFKLHPAFINENGEELDYILLSAYQGSIETIDTQIKYKDITYNNFTSQKLASVSNAKPISSYVNALNPMTGEQIAQNRGTNWHLMTSKIYSLEQMLQIIEAKCPEVQSIFGRGIVDIDNSETSADISLTGNTGATSQNGNNINSISSTIFDRPEGAIIKNQNGKSSINYRGVENPYGNAWKILGDTLLNERNLYICNNFNYSTNITNNYTSSQLIVPSIIGWISSFNYNAIYDWLFLPVSAQDNADELGPIGDVICVQNTNGPQVIGVGGGYLSRSRGGIFCFDARTSGQNLGLKTYTVRLVYIPKTSDSNYQTNITKWRAQLGG